MMQGSTEEGLQATLMGDDEMRGWMQSLSAADPRESRAC
jgi:hypothetical protein